MAAIVTRTSEDDEDRGGSGRAERRETVPVVEEGLERFAHQSGAG